MKSQFLVATNKNFAEANIYADKSSLVLCWLLKEGISRNEFSLREVAKDTRVSLGLVQRMFETLVWQGFLQARGVRTAKKFSFSDSVNLLNSWLKHYSILKKCKMRTYSSAFSDRNDLIAHLKASGHSQNVALALHSAADSLGVKHSNLTTLELYLLDPSIRLKLEKVLLLEPKERGYEVLLIEPYYKSLLIHCKKSFNDMNISPPLLTYLDLYHFPLRGREQAEYMAERLSELKQITSHVKTSKSRR